MFSIVDAEPARRGRRRCCRTSPAPPRRGRSGRRRAATKASIASSSAGSSRGEPPGTDRSHAGSDGWAMTSDVGLAERRGRIERPADVRGDGEVALPAAPRRRARRTSRRGATAGSRPRPPGGWSTPRNGPRRRARGRPWASRPAYARSRRMWLRICLQQCDALDAIDHKIVALLVENARRSYDDIGQRVSLSAPAVKRRVDRLRDDGAVRGFTAVVDHAALGAQTEALVELFYAPGTLLDSVAETLGAPPRGHRGLERHGRGRRDRPRPHEGQRRPRAADHGPPARRPRRPDPLADRHERPRRPEPLVAWMA